MKKITKIIFCLETLFIILICPGSIFADEVTEARSRMYKKAKTLKQKYEIMLDIVELDNRDMIPVLIDALDELIQQSLYINIKEKVILNDLKILVVKELGDLRASKATEYLFTVVIEADDPHLKGAALIALGKIGATEYARDIALILKKLTLYRGEDLKADETIAHACIYALERIADPVGYLPIFFATTAGFSWKIKETAEKALVVIADDPSDILTGLILNETSFQLKLEGLRAENQSNAPDSKKIEVAAKALNEGLINKPADVDEETCLREIRRLALEMIIVLKSKNKEPIPLIEQVLYIHTDDTEKILAIEALRSISGDKAAGALTRFLAYQNDRQGSGVTARDNRIVIATIRALGNVASKAGYQELLNVKYMGYPAVVGREAEKALKSLE